MIELYSYRFDRMRALIFPIFGEYCGKVPGAPRHQGKPAGLQVQQKSLAESPFGWVNDARALSLFNVFNADVFFAFLILFSFVRI